MVFDPRLARELDEAFAVIEACGAPWPCLPVEAWRSSAEPGARWSAVDGAWCRDRATT